MGVERAWANRMWCCQKGEKGLQVAMLKLPGENGPAICIVRSILDGGVKGGGRLLPIKGLP